MSPIILAAIVLLVCAMIYYNQPVAVPPAVGTTTGAATGTAAGAAAGATTGAAGGATTGAAGGAAAVDYSAQTFASKPTDKQVFWSTVGKPYMYYGDGGCKAPNAPDFTQIPATTKLPDALDKWCPGNIKTCLGLQPTANQGWGVCAVANGSGPGGFSTMSEGAVGEGSWPSMGQLTAPQFIGSGIMPSYQPFVSTKGKKYMWYNDGGCPKGIAPTSTLSPETTANDAWDYCSTPANKCGGLQPTAQGWGVCASGNGSGSGGLAGN